MQPEPFTAPVTGHVLSTLALTGRRVGVTRAAAQSESLRYLLSEQGAIVQNIPVVRIGPAPDERLLRREVEKLSTFDWIVFTSANAVNPVTSLIGTRRRAERLPQIAAVGSATARAITSAGLQVNYVSGSNGNILGATLPDVRDAKVLLPQSNIALRSVADELRKRGANVTAVVAYVTERDESAAPLTQAFFSHSVDAVIFTSPSTVKFFFELATRVGIDVVAFAAMKTKWVCIGPTTSRALEAWGLHAAAVAECPSDDALVVATAGLFYD
ncbi:MAG: uroporphyrinogen-III synthase [Gemmatimonadaceae bacterium]